MKRNYEIRAGAIKESAKKANETETRELVLFCSNTSEVYFRHVEPTIRALEKHAKRGEYSENAAIVAWKNCADACAKEYARMYDSENWNFPVASRCSAAIELEKINKENVFYNDEIDMEKLNKEMEKLNEK